MSRQRTNATPGTVAAFLIAWVAIACASDSVSGQTSRAADYVENGVRAHLAGNFGEAAKWYRQAADLGNADAQVALGALYQGGDGVPRDFVEAVKWYAKGALQGHTVGQAYLGTMYLQARGVPQDYREALRWLQLAADKKNAHAEYNLAYMYEFGLGVPRSRGLAVHWYRRSDEHGHPEAAFAWRHLQDPTNVSFRTQEERDQYLWNQLRSNIEALKESDRRAKADCDRRRRAGESWLQC